jgi:hypothetical protein
MSQTFQTLAEIESYEQEVSPGAAKLQRRTALNWSGRDDPWVRGVFGAALGLAVGVPLSVPIVASAAGLGALHAPAAWGQILVALPNFGFPLYGFVFGYFLPLIRGNSGIAKAATLLAVLVLTEATGLLVSDNPLSDIGGALALRGVQLTMLCAVLGVASDWLALSAVHQGIDRLADLYSVNRLTLWSSGIMVTAATALVTGIIGSAAGLLVTHVLPPSNPPTSSTQVGNPNPP